MTEERYVLTFDPRPVTSAEALNGLRRMPLAEARDLSAEAARIPMHGRIIDAETLEVVSA
jgi:hypothetical protein